MNFEAILERTVKKEAGYSNNSKDRGGETIWGITVAVARAFGYARPMILMSREEAKDIYRQRYWTQPRFDQIEGISKPIAYKLFDVGVNMGQEIAAGFLQRALNVLNREGKLYPDIRKDGQIGMMTLSSLRNYLAYREAKGEAVLLEMITSQQSVRYIDIAENRPADEEFEFGWQANRVLEDA